MDNEMQKQACEILLMPIEVSNSSGFGNDRKVEIKRKEKL